MILRTIHINNWTADIYYCITHYEEGELELALRDIDAPISITARMRQIARDDEYNTGFTFSNQAMRHSVVVIGKTTSSKEFLNTFVHEVRHLADDIASADGISLRGEEVAYLSGNIAADMFDIVGLFTCPSCKKKGSKIGYSGIFREWIKIKNR